MRDLSALANMAVTSVRTSADRIGSSSPRTCVDVSCSLVVPSSWHGVAWWLVPLASTQQGRVHAARRSRSCWRGLGQVGRCEKNGPSMRGEVWFVFFARPKRGSDDRGLASVLLCTFVPRLGSHL